MTQPTQKTKRKPKAAPADRILPQSIENETAVLGCIFLQPGLIAECKRRIKRSEAFFDVRHQTIWRALCEAPEGSATPQTICQRLKDRKLLTDAGGDVYIHGLQDQAHSAANLPYHLAIVCEKYEQRRHIQLASDILERAYSYQGPFDDYQYATRSDLEAILGQEEESREQVWTIKDLNGFDADKDPSALIGVRNGKATRYICKGYGTWLIGPSGVGKSSLIHQIAFSFALGRPVFGIAPVRPLTILIVQAENDQGDAAEMTQGILRSFGIDEFSEEMLEVLNTRVHIITERRTIGESFCVWLRKMIEKYRADIVFGDPFLSFAGVDVSRLDQCTKFLRSHLNPVLADTGAALIAAHHTGKPKFDKNIRTPTAIDYAYAGIGSSELVNWARAVMVLVPLGEHGHFELKLAKRGLRAGAHHPDKPDGEPGEFTTSIFLRHASDRIFWEQVEAPEEPEAETQEPKHREKQKSKVEQIADSNLHEILSRIPASGESAKSLGQRFQAFAIAKGIRVGLTTCRTDLLYELGSDQRGMLRLDPEKQIWFRGPNA